MSITEKIFSKADKIEKLEESYRLGKFKNYLIALDIEELYNGTLSIEIDGIHFSFRDNYMVGEEKSSKTVHIRSIVDLKYVLLRHPLYWF